MISVILLLVLVIASVICLPIIARLQKDPGRMKAAWGLSFSYSALVVIVTIARFAFMA